MKLSKFVTYDANIGGLECRAGVGMGGQFVLLGDKLFTSLDNAQVYLIKEIDDRDGYSPAVRYRLTARLKWLEAVVIDLSQIGMGKS